MLLIGIITPYYSFTEWIAWFDTLRDESPQDYASRSQIISNASSVVIERVFFLYPLVLPLSLLFTNNAVG
jgi:hypothetical protein